MNLLLARKDVRILRPVIVAAVLVAIFFEVAMPALGAYTDRHGWHGSHLAQRTWGSIAGGAYAALVLTTGLAALFGGAAVTIERRERWGELAAMLPVSPHRRAIVSLATGAGLLALCWTFHLALLLVAAPRTAGLVVAIPYLVTTIACFAVGTFGLAWLLSSFLRSAAIVASVTLGVVVGGLFVTWALDGLLPSGDPMRPVSGWNPGRFVPAYTALLVATGLIGCVVGTLLSSRRVVP